MNWGKVPRAATQTVVKGLLVAGNYSNEHAIDQAGKPFFFLPLAREHRLCSEIRPMASLPGGCAPVALSQVVHCAPFGQEALGITPIGILAHSGKNFLQKPPS